MELELIWAALVCYVLAGCVAIVGNVLRKQIDRPFLLLMVTGLGLHGASIGLRWARVGHGPFVTLFEALSSNIFSLLLVYMGGWIRFKPIRPTAAITVPLMFILMGWLLVVDPVQGHLPPTYHTIWLYIHVAFGKVFLGGAFIALGMALTVLLRRVALARPYLSTLPNDQSLDELAYRFMAIAFIFEGLMLVAGAIWAQDAWGRYWSWDPLETWAFITWLTAAIALHTRVTFRPGPAAGALLIVVVFVLAFLTFFGVPFISEHQHKGAI